MQEVIVNQSKKWSKIPLARTWDSAKEQLELIFELLDESPAIIFQSAGLSRALYYKSLGPKSGNFAMRPATVEKLAKVLLVDYAYVGNFPFFGHVLLETQTGLNFRDVIRESMEGVLSVELLAYKAGIPASELVDILDRSGKIVSIPITVFKNLAHALDFSIMDTADNFIQLLNSEREVGRYAGYIDKNILRGSDTETTENQSEVSDDGLKELLTPANRFQYSLTMQEADELTKICIRRNSKATLSQWVTILYAIRSLDD